MQSFQVLTAVAAPLLRENLDTDVIIRIERLTDAKPDLQRWCFEALRYLPDGSPNPDFILNQANYSDAQILLGGPNFGCGSSREGAVWALMKMGLRCVIAPSFGQIFYANCFQNGLLPVALPLENIQQLAAEVRVDPHANQLTVDLPQQQIISPSGDQHPFTIPAFLKESLLEGLDALDVILKREPQIAEFQRTDRERRPWIYQTVEQST